jgi:alpha-L-arabinofuranosidase
MPTFGAWERTVLQETFDDADFISCHAYYEEVDGDAASFLASAVDMDHFIEAVVATADAVAAEKKSTKRINISFDEWNVWYNTRYRKVERITDPGEWPVAPRLLEDSYSVLDAVVVGSLLISLLKHADRVQAAALAQLVNVIAPIMTEPGGPAWRQTTFFPFALTARLAVGVSLPVNVDSPTYETQKYGTVELIDGVVTHDETSGSTAVFLVNRSLDQSVDACVGIGGLDVRRIRAVHVISDDDMYAANTLDDQERVAPHGDESATLVDGRLAITLPPVSWTVVELAAE